MVGGAVLAGGRSSRMGTAKAGLAFGQKTLLELSVDRLLQLASPVWVVGAGGGDFPGPGS